MRIAYDNLIFKLQQYGGVSRYFSELIQRTKNHEGVAVRTVDVAKGRLAGLSSSMLGIIFSLGKTQLYHPTYYSDAVKKRQGVKTVITVFDMIHELFLSKNKNFQNDIAVKKKCIQEADHIICISENTRKDLLKIYPVSKEKTSVIYLGVSKVGGKIMPQTGATAQRSFVLFVGVRGGYKNFPTLLEAFYRSGIASDSALVCFGGGAFSKEEKLAIEQKGLGANVLQIDGDDQALAEQYMNAGFLVYPSAYEGFGLPVVEAMSLGCPVIASNTSSLPEVAGGAAAMFFPDNPDELALAMRKLMNDPEERSRLRELGLARAREFTWEKTAHQTFELYNSILGG